MESQPQSDKPISILTVADLEAIIVKIVQKVLEQEIGTLEQHRDLQEVETVENYLPKALLDTFGTWEDVRTAEEIIDDIYHSRNLPKRKYSL